MEIKLFYVILGLAIVLLFVNCNSSKQKNLTAKPENTITIGSGGGFTGAIKAFKLGTDGVVTVDNKEVLKFKKSQAKQFFENVNTLGLWDVTQNEPGNMYSFIELNIDGKEHRIVWGSRDSEPNKNAKLFYDNLNYMFNKLIQ